MRTANKSKGLAAAFLLSIPLAVLGGGSTLYSPAEKSTRVHCTLLRTQLETNALRLVSLKGESSPALTLRPQKGVWDISRYRAVEFTITNTGAENVEFTLWALSPGGWSGASTYPENTNGRVSLKSGEGAIFPIDLWAHFPGPDTFSGVVDARSISELQIILQPGARMVTPMQLDLFAVRTVGTAPSSPPDKSKRIRVPEISEEPPVAGRRVWRALPAYSQTRLRHVLTLPRDWRKEGSYPVIVEYTGNEFYYKFCHSTGLTEQGTMAYGLSRGEGFICLNLPFVTDDKREQHNGFGNETNTIDYCIAALRDTFEHFGGDSSAVILTGFSRGRIAMNYLALRDNRIADVWLGFVGANPGEKWPGGTGWKNSHIGWDERAARILGRPWIDVHPKFWPGVHVDVEYLEDVGSTLETRSWLHEIVKNRPGLHDIHGRIADANGNGMPGLRVETGPTRFAVSNAEGKYTIRSVPDGERLLSVVGPCFSQSKLIRRVRIEGTDLHGIDFQLER